MFKNRVRTAALAGAIAVATGVSGLSVPAYAQDPLTGNHHNQPDSSKQGTGTEFQNIPATARVKAADALRDAANADKAAIANHKFVNFEDAKHRPIEANSKAAADRKAAEATALLNNSTATLNDVLATLKAVEAETKAAEDAWRTYATAVTITKAEKEALVKLAEQLEVSKYADGGNYQDLKTLIEDIPSLTMNPGDADYVAEVRNLHEESVQKILAFDTAARYYMETQLDHHKVANSETAIDASNAATTLYAQLNSYLDGWDDRDKLYRNAIQKTSVATNRNIVVIRQAYERAQANVRAARTLQAYYLFASRWLDLYENDVLKNNEDADRPNTVRAEYEAALFGNQSLRDRALDARNTQDSNLAWESQVQRVRLIDQRYTVDAAATAAAANAKAAQDKDLNAKITSIADSLDKIANGNKGGSNNTDKPQNQGNNGSGAQGQVASSNNGNNADNKQGLKTFGIIAGIIAAIAALLGVANMPQVQAMLKR